MNSVVFCAKRTQHKADTFFGALIVYNEVITIYIIQQYVKFLQQYNFNNESLQNIKTKTTKIFDIGLSI